VRPPPPPATQPPTPNPPSLKVHDRAARLGLLEGSPPVALMSEASLDAALAAVADLRPGVMIVDSIQTMVLDGVEGRAGSMLQVRECAAAGGCCRGLLVPPPSGGRAPPAPPP
jgi:hypothetical protein